MQTGGETAPRVFTERARPARLVESSADLEQPGILLIAPAWPAALLRSTAELLVADHRQHRAQPLVVDNRPLVDLLDLVKGAVSQLDALVTDRQAAGGVVDYGDPLADCRLGLLDRGSKPAIRCAPPSRQNPFG